MEACCTLEPFYNSSRLTFGLAFHRYYCVLYAASWALQLVYYTLVCSWYSINRVSFGFSKWPRGSSSNTGNCLQCSLDNNLHHSRFIHFLEMSASILPSRFLYHGFWYFSAVEVCTLDKFSQKNFTIPLFHRVATFWQTSFSFSF